MTRIALLLVAVSLVAAACSGDDEGATGSTGAAQPAALRVLADSSLEGVLPAIVPEADYVFAGTAELAARIEEGETADVLAAAGAAAPAALAGKALVEPPQAFATNRLVLVVPSGNPRGIRSVDDVSDVGLMNGAEPGYARATLEAMGKGDVLQNVDYAPEAAELVASGDLDAAFVYLTDAQRAGAAVEVIELPAQALLEYSLAFLTTSENSEGADAFMERVLGEESRQKLEAAGFGLPGG
jgi:molybdate transport system substrate-binding protein